MSSSQASGQHYDDVYIDMRNILQDARTVSYEKAYRRIYVICYGSLLATRLTQTQRVVKLRKTISKFFVDHRESIAQLEITKRNTFLQCLNEIFSMYGRVAQQRNEVKLRQLFDLLFVPDGLERLQFYASEPTIPSDSAQAAPAIPSGAVAQGQPAAPPVGSQVQGGYETP